MANNDKFIKKVKVDTHIGELELGIISTERTNRPKGLKQPYEYILPLAKATKSLRDLKKFLNSQDEAKFQCCGLFTKAVSKGIRVSVFILSYNIDHSVDKTGCTETEWNELTKETQEKLFAILGKDAEMYIEPFTKERKFQARLQTYIAYKEMLQS